MHRPSTAAALVAASFAILGATTAGAATISGFTGPYAPSTWSSATSGMLPGGTDGSATFTPTSLTLVGGDDPFVDPTTTACVGAITGLPGMCQVQTTHGRVGASDTYSFNWSYTTTDIGAGNDLFGVLVDGVRTVLSDPGGLYPTQTGSLTVSPVGTFGFFINCTDCVGGGATATVSGFSVAAVPEPATIALVGVGIAAVVATRRRRGASRVPLAT